MKPLLSGTGVLLVSLARGARLGEVRLGVALPDERCVKESEYRQREQQGRQHRPRQLRSLGIEHDGQRLLGPEEVDGDMNEGHQRGAQDTDHGAEAGALARLAADVSPAQGVIIEAILTFMLAFAVMGTAVDPRAPKVGGFAIGLMVFVDIVAGGQMTGAAMNPARAFGSMLVGWQWTGALIYWIGPILGAVVAMQLYERLLMDKTQA